MQPSPGHEGGIRDLTDDAAAFLEHVLGVKSLSKALREYWLSHGSELARILDVTEAQAVSMVDVGVSPG